MFCPVGYRSAAEIWHEFRKKRLPAVYESASQAYLDHQTNFSLLRGSPLDICEFIFLNSLCEVGFYLSSPLGNIVRVFVSFEDERQSIFSVLTPHDSAYNYAAAGLENVYDASAKKIEGNEYSSWKYEVAERDSWSKNYPILTKEEFEANLVDGFLIQFHTLPRFFIRSAYMIANHLPPWAIDYANNLEIFPIIEHYAGWSICIDEATFQGEWKEYLSGRKPIILDNAATERVAKAGRPRLEKAYSAFASMGFDKGELSWAQLRAKILRVTGEEPSDKALRNWRDQNFLSK